MPHYSGHTHALYACQLRRWFAWCETNALDPLVGIQRAHIELYIRHLGESGLTASSVNTSMHAVRGFFRFAHIDGVIPSDPAVYARLPKVHRDESRTQGLDRLELIRFLQVAQTITVHHGALAYLLGINALRASEAAAVRIEDYDETLRGHRVLRLVGNAPRLEEDVNSFVGSIGEPVCLVGFSTSGPLVLGAAIHSGAVAAVAVYDLLVGSVMREEDLASLGAMLEQMSAAAAEGRLVDAARTSHHHTATDDEFAALEAGYLGGEYFERCAEIVPAALQWVQQGAAYEGLPSTDPEMLAQIAAPVLVLRGQETPPWLGTVLANSEQHTAHHVADLHARVPLPGLGHYAPLLAPERIARELISFFELVR